MAAGCGLGGKLGAGRVSINRLADRVTHEIMHDRTMAESHLGLRRMDIHVHFRRIAMQEQQRERITGRRDQVVIRRADRVHQQPVANQPAIDENIDRVAIVLLHLRARNKAVQRINAHWLVRFRHLARPLS